MRWCFALSVVLAADGGSSPLEFRWLGGSDAGDPPGSMDPAEIRVVARSHHGDLKRCYDEVGRTGQVVSTEEPWTTMAVRRGIPALTPGARPSMAPRSRAETAGPSAPRPTRAASGPAAPGGTAWGTGRGNC